MIASSYNNTSLIWKSGNRIERWSSILQNVMFYTSQQSVIRMFMSISLKDKSWTLCILSNTLVSTSPTTSAGTNMLKEGRTGVLPWCRIGWFYFPWNMNLINYSSWSGIWRFCVTREGLELLTDIRDFTTLFGVILRCECSGRLILRLKTSNVTSNRLRYN